MNMGPIPMIVALCIISVMCIWHIVIIVMVRRKDKQWCHECIVSVVGMLFCIVFLIAQLCTP